MTLLEQAICAAKIAAGKTGLLALEKLRRG
jgi:hypothetical protein